MEAAGGREKLPLRLSGVIRRAIEAMRALPETHVPNHRSLHRVTKEGRVACDLPGALLAERCGRQVDDISMLESGSAWDALLALEAVGAGDWGDAWRRMRRAFHRVMHAGSGEEDAFRFEEETSMHVATGALRKLPAPPKPRYLNGEEAEAYCEELEALLPELTRIEAACLRPKGTARPAPPVNETPRERLTRRTRVDLQAAAELTEDLARPERVAALTRALGREEAGSVREALRTARTELARAVRETGGPAEREPGGEGTAASRP